MRMMQVLIYGVVLSEPRRFKLSEGAGACCLHHNSVPVDDCLEAPGRCGGEAPVSLGINVKLTLPETAIRR